MKRYIKSSEELKSGSYMLSKDGKLDRVYFHAPSTTYATRHIYHLAPTDADFLKTHGKISDEDANVIVRYCFKEYMKNEKKVDDDYTITSDDVMDFASYGDLMGAPVMFMAADDCEGETVSKLCDDSKFKSLNDKWYKWLKNNFVKTTLVNDTLEFRIDSDGYDWNDIIIDDVILKYGKDNSKLKYNVLKEDGDKVKTYFKQATLNEILEDDKKVLSSKIVKGQKRMNIRKNSKYGRIYSASTAYPAEYKFWDKRTEIKDIVRKINSELDRDAWKWKVNVWRNGIELKWEYFEYLKEEYPYVAITYAHPKDRYDVWFNINVLDKEDISYSVEYNDDDLNAVIRSTIGYIQARW